MRCCASSTTASGSRPRITRGSSIASSARAGRENTAASASACGSLAASSRRSAVASRCGARPARDRRSPSRCHCGRKRPMPPSNPEGPILVVDDDPDVRDAIVDTLQDEGYHVVQTPGGREALVYLRSNPPPSLIFLDWNMAPMNASQFMDEFCKEPSFRRAGGPHHRRPPRQPEGDDQPLRR